MEITKALFNFESLVNVAIDSFSKTSLSIAEAVCYYNSTKEAFLHLAVFTKKIKAPGSFFVYVKSQRPY